MGGGAVGVGLGAASATPLAMLIQNFIAENIDDPRIRQEVMIDLTPKAVVEETVINGLLFGVGAHFSELITDFLGLIVGRTLAMGLRLCMHWLCSRW